MKTSNKKTISEKGLEMLVKHEGVMEVSGKIVNKIDENGQYKAYKDVAGHWTHGVGHLIKESEKHLIEKILSGKEVKELLRKDLAMAESVLNYGVLMELEQNKFDALVSLIFNIGKGAFLSSTLYRKLLALETDNTVLKQWFLAWRYVTVNGEKLPKLLSRREKEWELFETGNYV